MRGRGTCSCRLASRLGVRKGALATTGGHLVWLRGWHQALWQDQQGSRVWPGGPGGHSPAPERMELGGSFLDGRSPLFLPIHSAIMYCATHLCFVPIPCLCRRSLRRCSLLVC
jgi:hypothetical protein